MEDALNRQKVTETKPDTFLEKENRSATPYWYLNAKLKLGLMTHDTIPFFYIVLNIISRCSL